MSTLRAFRRAPLSVRAETQQTRTRGTTRAAPRPGNVDGPFWIDKTCIDCDLCRRMAPSVYTRLGDGSVVSRQPSTKEERVDSLQALLSCPTNSIHAETIDKTELKAAQQGLPKPVPGCPNVYACGWHSVKSFSAASYFIQRPEGNILVDSPRYNPILAKRLEEMGGVKYMFLSHKDDVADHEAWARHFRCPRIMHQADIGGSTQGVEVQLKGEGPWDLTGSTVSELATADGAVATGGNGGSSSSTSSSSEDDGSGGGGSGSGSAGGTREGERDVTLVYTPGHTRGHVCLYYGPSKALFSGDHLSQDDDHLDGSPDGSLYIFTDFNWYSVPEQVRSVAKLRRYNFLTVLPGHGRIMSFRDAAHRANAFERLLSQHGYKE